MEVGTPAVLEGSRKIPHTFQEVVTEHLVRIGKEPKVLHVCNAVTVFLFLFSFATKGESVKRPNASSE
ncbi:MAG TPA: hypothetical protein VG498_10905, partial [Terriglobales bacterium]|nr:hypothetical protein [Terriglobales bacterium]